MGVRRVPWSPASDTLLAIAEEGSFTAAADALATVQSNVSDQVRQLEAELGVPLLVRSRKGAEPTEFGVLVLDRARRVNRELEAMRADLALLQGLDAGYARLGVVGTMSVGWSRWSPTATARRECACANEVRRSGSPSSSGELARPSSPSRSTTADSSSSTCSRRSSSASSAARCQLRARCRWRVRQVPLVPLPDPNPLRIEVDRAAEGWDQPDRTGRGRRYPLIADPGWPAPRVDPP
jgi:molybdenum-dependent DNA-binding transcriptional regulator ModE